MSEEEDEDEEDEDCNSEEEIWANIAERAKVRRKSKTMKEIESREKENQSITRKKTEAGSDEQNSQEEEEGRERGTKRQKTQRRSARNIKRMRGSQRRKVLRAKLRRQRAGIEEKEELKSEDEEESSPNSSDSELENMKCECCGRGDDDDKMLLCDGEGCNKGYHIYCIFPPLDAIPEEDWYCDQCQLLRNNPFPVLPEGYPDAVHNTSYDPGSLASPILEHADGAAKGTDEGWDWMDTMGFNPIITKTPEEEEQEERQRLATTLEFTSQFSVSSVDMAKDFARSATSSPLLNGFGTDSSNSTPAPLAVPKRSKQEDMKTIILWQGGVSLEGGSMGDITLSFRGTEAHAIECKQIVREWVDRGSLPTGKKFTSLPAFPPNVHMLHVLPGSTKANYAYFASYLEEKGVICLVSFQRSDLYIFPSSLNLPSHMGSSAQLDANLTKIMAVLVPKASALKPVQKIQPNVPVLGKAPALQQRVHENFMAGVRFVLLGYPTATAAPAAGSAPPQPQSAEEARVNNIVSFLTRSGGAVYVKETEFNATNTDLIIVNPRVMHRLPSETAGILQCRMNPSVMFVKDINYLENCCKMRLFLPPPPSDIVYPSGGIITLQHDAIMSRDNLIKEILTLLKEEGKEGREWIIKIPMEGLAQIEAQKAFLPKAQAAAQAIKESASLVQAITGEEMSKSANVDVPPIIRSAVKLSFVHSAKYRHTILLTDNKHLQAIAKGQKLLCMPLEALKGFFEDQAKQRAQGKKLNFASASLLPAAQASSSTSSSAPPSSSQQQRTNSSNSNNKSDNSSNKAVV